jgi:hypothetical protein
LDAAATPLEAEAGDKTPLNRVMRARIMARRYTTTKLSRLEREILSRWFDGEDLDSDLIERFVKRYETEWCANWSVPGDYLDDEVVVGTLVGNRFEAVKVLSVWGSWMMAGGVDIYLVDVDSHDRQLLYFDDSILECSCASRLCTFATDAIMQELRSIVVESIAARAPLRGMAAKVFWLAKRK